MQSRDRALQNGTAGFLKKPTNELFCYRSSRAVRRVPKPTDLASRSLPDPSDAPDYVRQPAP